MAIGFFERCDTIEECYEFMLAYAGHGLPSDRSSQAGSQIRGFLERAAHALTGLAESCARAVTEERLEPAERYHAFITLNASIHLRALLTDVFLLGEILRSRSSADVIRAGE